MQRAEGPSSRLAPEPTPTRPSLSPPVAFLLLAAVIAILGAIVFLTRPETPVTPTNPNAAQQQPDFSLTNEEAITRFEELNRMRLQMYESRDASLASEFLAAGSPLRKVAESEIQQMLNDDVLVEMNFKTIHLDVIENSEQEIVLRQTVVEAPVFTDEKGSDLTRSPPQRRVVEWTLVLDASVWKLDDLQVLQSRDLKK